MKRGTKEKIEHELAHEDEEMLREMSPEERRKYIIEQAKEEAYREANGFYDD